MKFDARKMTRTKPKSKVCKIEGCSEPKVEQQAVCREHLRLRRKEYGYHYYRTHKEQAKAYQEAYNLEYRKKRGEGRQTCSAPKCKTIKTAYHIHDIQHVTGTRLIQRLNEVIGGQKMLVGVK
jgi:hypothetical protein